eukprot:8827519-Karenia_brevis.AAC.1
MAISPGGHEKAFVGAQANSASHRYCSSHRFVIAISPCENQKACARAHANVLHGNEEHVIHFAWESC